MHHLAGDVREPVVTAAVAVREPLVIEAHQVQNRGVQVVNVNRILDCLEAEVVRRAVRDPALDTTSG